MRLPVMLVSAPVMLLSALDLRKAWCEIASSSGATISRTTCHDVPKPLPGRFIHDTSLASKTNCDGSIPNFSTK
jgi:hypothetical protein